MAVVHCEEVTGRDGSEDVNENKRYSRTFQLLTDDPNDSAATVRAFAGLPAYRDPHPDDPDAFAVDKRASQTDPENHQNWVCVVEYVGRGDPTLEPPDVDFTEEAWQETKQRDELGQPVANAADDLYEGGLTRDQKRGILVIERNVLTYDPDVADAVRNTTNLAPILADRFPGRFPAESCKLDSFTAKAVWYEDQSDIHYWRVTLRIAVNKAGWQAEYLNAGYQAYFPVTVGMETVYKKNPIIFGPATARVPQMLNADGTHPLVGGPNYLTFVRYLPTDWSDIAGIIEF